MKCYICRKQISARNSHPFYKRMCKDCGDMNWKKRQEFVSLEGYIALVTGGRIKIGYETSLKLLRSGAFVIVTTRFPVDAINRYCIEKDFSEWCNRLIIYQIDFRKIQSVYTLIDFLYNKLMYIDILINNAAQTVRHTCDYYRELIQTEEKEYQQLPAYLKSLIIRQDDTSNLVSLQSSLDNLLPLPSLKLESVSQKDSAIAHSKTTSFFASEVSEKIEINSWTSKACDISLVEMLEVQLINVTAPFALCTGLRQLMEQSIHQYKYIINVSAMEGKFSKKNKNCFHPHTNMAKASLNMLTRTSAQDFIKSGIIMNSVDTGWITDENPDWIRKQNEDWGLTPPLDARDGASRLCNPIFSSIAHGNHEYGMFFKDYVQTEW